MELFNPMNNVILEVLEPKFGELHVAIFLPVNLNMLERCVEELDGLRLEGLV